MKGEEYISSIETDKKFIHAINVYRSHYLKDTLTWDKEVYNAAMHHTKYLLLSDDFSHNETKEVQGLQKMKTLADRTEHFIGKTKAAGENIIGGTYAILIGDSTTLSDFVRDVFRKELKDCQPTERIMYRTIYDWSNSPKHNENLLNNFKYGAVSLFYTDTKIFPQDIFFKGKAIQEQKLYCTFNGIRF